MILFALRCAGGHQFEGWFRDNAAYDRQSSRGLIACPECGSNKVDKAPMAPRLGRSTKDPVESAPPPARREEAPPSVPVPVMAEQPPTPAQVRHALQVLRRHIERHYENVGPKFAEEARRIHKGEARLRGIYGEATPADTEKLLEEGIEIASIPWVPSNDA
jgi:hypothetical protein